MKTLCAPQSGKDLLRSLRGRARHGGPRCLARRPAGRVRLGRRPVRLRQDDDPQHDRRLHSLLRRRDSARWQTCRWARAGTRRRVSVVRIVPVADRARQCRRSVRKCAACRRPSATEIAREYLALAGLSHAAERYPNELSGGMQQRVGVVRALANESGGAVDGRTLCQRRCADPHDLAGGADADLGSERRPTVVFITHDVAEAVFLANRVVVLSQGTHARRDGRRLAAASCLGRPRQR